ncbi:MAG: aminotransferase class I/II-fold pyridoxal phosphate-dependent enzyme [Polaromonas sp.]|uniref:aminotransferase class I/II-fold pyridoxal phosphate-dependent enzyme n=1 Tax=Polaromonas sp. TaxID=1869339 RepID=UPI00273000E7|nr:aminotransferase class I/II-fold pyridoxal phosphate-dependent enzyme [Polaromonas sp.]MDP2254600.1 aminotransferase class I/II-fold pyridoxal phosphate-dependent enzyme [Polaromonas sp.]
MTSPQRIHGGPDALGVPRFDFSTNSNACGPCPIALAAVQQADARHYPDASYAALRAQLAAFHGVEVQRVLLAGSASEFIFRITAYVAQQGARHASHLSRLDTSHVALPPHSYGDYAQAAQAWGLGVTTRPDAAQLVWACEPSSPLGGAHVGWPDWLTGLNTRPDTPLSVRAEPAQALPLLVFDRAYEPLRLSGAPALNEAQLAQVWQLWTPNKALGLTGVRAAYAIAPLGAQAAVAALERLCPSWPVGAHGVAMLQAWVQPEAQAWLADSLQTLRDWKTRQIAVLHERGWHCLPSDTPFFCARPATACDLSQLRAIGIKLRDATSFGLPGHVRVSVQPPVAQDALALALQGY